MLDGLPKQRRDVGISDICVSIKGPPAPSPVPAAALKEQPTPFTAGCTLYPLPLRSAIQVRRVSQTRRIKDGWESAWRNLPFALSFSLSSRETSIVSSFVNDERRTRMTGMIHVLSARYRLTAIYIVKQSQTVWQYDELRIKDILLR